MAKSFYGRSLRLPSIDRWALAALLATTVLLAPIASVLWIALLPEENLWPHLLRTALPGYLRNTLLLMTLVAAGTAVVGTGTAWLVARYRFPGRSLFEWALLAPLAVPAYIAAYTLVDFLEYAGPVQTALRGAFGWHDARDYWFPEIRSLGSAAVAMTFAFYPYVYLLARTAFRAQSATASEVARSLGRGPWGAMVSVALPLARPAVVAGVALALMETLNDFGTVDYFAVPTLTTGVFGIWFEAYDLGSAAQIALALLVLVFGLLAIERAARRGAKFHDTSTRFHPTRLQTLTGRTGRAACAACLAPIAIGFLLPVGVLARRVLPHLDQFREPDFLAAMWHTAALAAVAATLATALGLFLIYGARASRSSLPRQITRLASLGYAVPGVLLAVGILIPLLAIDRLLAALGWIDGLLFGGSVAALGFAYLVRFAAIPHGAIEAGFAQVTPSMEMVARSLGETRAGTLWRVHLPLIQGSLLASWLLVFVESAKELPATLILRPFNYETLATHVYVHASLEQLEAAAPAALAVITVGLAPAVLFRFMLRPPPWTRHARMAKTHEAGDGKQSAPEIRQA